MIVGLAARRSFVMVALAGVTVGLMACSGAGDPVTRLDLVNSLRQEDTGPLSQEMAECVAGEMLDADLSEDQQREFVEEDKSDPGAIDVYNEAVTACESEFGGG